uniref:Uncharacterized protein n=1 Tax=Glossina austeni TaxID=7395 RepID=A0A1A9UXJ9_GLOAU
MGKSGHAASYGFGLILLRPSNKTAQARKSLKAATNDGEGSSGFALATVMPTKRDAEEEKARNGEKDISRYYSTANPHVSSTAWNHATCGVSDVQCFSLVLLRQSFTSILEIPPITNSNSRSSNGRNKWLGINSLNPITGQITYDAMRLQTLLVSVNILAENKYFIYDIDEECTAWLLAPLRSHCELDLLNDDAHQVLGHFDYYCHLTDSCTSSTVSDQPDISNYFVSLPLVVRRSSHPSGRFPSDESSSEGPRTSPAGPTIANGFPLQEPSFESSAIIICPRTSSSSSEDILPKSKR